MRTHVLLIIGALTLTGSSMAYADVLSQNDEMAIRGSVRAYVQAFERQDAKALAALWSPKGVYVDAESGRRVQGREAIEAEFSRQLKASGKSKLKVAVQSIRLVTPEVAVEDGTASVTNAAGETTDSTYSAIHVKRDGKWLLDSVRETTLPAAGSASEQLRELGWLVGKWIDEDENAVVESEYSWGVNQVFLINRFTVYSGDTIAMQGTQIIGWDAAAKSIRSWAFDTEGGFAEGTWKRDGDRWTITSKATLPDGKRGSAVNVLRRIDDNHCSWQSTARQIDGELLPNTDEIEIVRQEEEFAQE